MASPAHAWKKTLKGPRPQNARMEQIVFQIEAGRPYEAIAGQFGISIQRVSQIRRQAGLPQRWKKGSI